MPADPFDRRFDPLWAEFARVAGLSRYEGRLRRAGYLRVAGVDEAGRGCFAGPVVAAAVVLPPDAPLLEADDSKKRPAEVRERVVGRIRSLGGEIGVGVVGPDVIDSDNILEATRRAMRDALSALPAPPDAILTDAIDLPFAWSPLASFVQGDARVLSIAAASMVAKTTRDALMDDLDERFPWYGFRSNRGYGTEDHREAIRRHGPSPIHRLTFRGVVPSGAPA